MAQSLEFTLQSVTAKELTIKVKNTGNTSLDKTLTIELYPPMHLVSKAVQAAAVAAADNEETPGAMRLDGIVSGPDGWSIWARRESSDTTMVIVVINDRNQNTGAAFKPPVKFPAGAESIIRIPLNPEANQDNTDLSYSYTHGDPNARVDGTLQIRPTKVDDWEPDVELTSTATNPTMVKPGEAVKVVWTIKDGVSAVLRGPLPGDNAELTLSSKSDADFQIAEGSLSVRVVGLMNYILQAEVKRPDGKPNVQVVRMLTLDTSNKQHLYIDVRHIKVLPYGLIEMDWAAWGVPQVIITASDTTRVIKLTQQTFGGSFEGNGVMRVSAGTTTPQTVILEGKPDGSRTKTVMVVSWQHMTKPDTEGHPWGLAVIAPYIGLLTFQGLYVAEVGKQDPETALKKLPFVKKTPLTPPMEFISLTAVGNRFMVLRRPAQSPDVEVAPFLPDGTPDVIPPVSLHPDLRMLVPHSKAIFDYVGFAGRAYLVVEAPMIGSGMGRRAYSVGFNHETKKAEYRSEPQLENLFGYRLAVFDDALYALNRETGRMFRFEADKNGRLESPREAKSAVRKENGQEHSMIRDGLFVPVGRVLVVLNPTSVPSLDSLEEYDLHNTLGYKGKSTTDPNSIPQDLVYNPQKNYWARCGHGLDIKDGAVAAFRDGESPRLWVVQPDGETYTLPVGSESLFVRDYVLDFPTRALFPYFNKKRKVTIKSYSAVGPIEEKYRKLGVYEVNAAGPREVSALPARPQAQFDVEVSYNEAKPIPVTLLLQMARLPQQRPDVDYLLEVTLSGPHLSTATSNVRRVSIIGNRLSSEEVFGSKVQHSTDSVIEVRRPVRFDENVRFVMVNASTQFKIKLKPVLQGWPTYILDEAFIETKNDTPDFTLEFEGKVQTQGVIGVNVNFALPPGIEASSGRQPQTKLIRLNTDNAQKIQVRLVQMLMPGDKPLMLQGAAKPIDPLSDRPVLVCQLDYKP